MSLRDKLKSRLQPRDLGTAEPLEGMVCKLRGLTIDDVSWSLQVSNGHPFRLNVARFSASVESLTIDGEVQDTDRDEIYAVLCDADSDLLLPVIQAWLARTAYESIARKSATETRLYISQLEAAVADLSEIEGADAITIEIDDSLRESPAQLSAFTGISWGDLLV